MSDQAIPPMYPEFARHAVDAALQAIRDAHEATGHRPLPAESVTQIRDVLIRGLSRIQATSQGEVASVEDALATPVFEILRANGELREVTAQEIRSAVAGLVVNIADVLRAFVDEVKPDTRSGRN